MPGLKNLEIMDAKINPLGKALSSGKAPGAASAVVGDGGLLAIPVMMPVGCRAHLVNIPEQVNIPVLKETKF